VVSSVLITFIVIVPAPYVIVFMTGFEPAANVPPCKATIATVLVVTKLLLITKLVFPPVAIELIPVNVALPTCVFRVTGVAPEAVNVPVNNGAPPFNIKFLPICTSVVPLAPNCIVLSVSETARAPKAPLFTAALELTLELHFLYQIGIHEIKNQLVSHFLVHLNHQDN